MKITGPTSGTPTPPAGDGAPTTRPTAPRKVFADALSEPASADAARFGGSDLAAALRAGKLNPSTAVEQVVERVLDRQLGADAPAAVREKVRAALRDALEGDPLLQEKVRRLAGA